VARAEKMGSGRSSNNQQNTHLVDLRGEELGHLALLLGLLSTPGIIQVLLTLPQPLLACLQAAACARGGEGRGLWRILKLLLALTARSCSCSESQKVLNF
jgi:hypothetical protein